MDYLAHVDEFRQAIMSAGLPAPRSIEADGALHRFSTSDRRRDSAGWYVLFPDSPVAGIFGCWRTGEQHTWRALPEKEWSPVDRQRYAEQMARAREARLEAEQARHQEVAAHAQKTWEGLAPAPADHPYLKRKQIAPYGLRIDEDGKLVVPMADTERRIWSLQRIAPDGTKRFLSGGRKRGCYAAIGKPNGLVCLAEGFATGATIHQATDHAVAVAFDAGNLEPVARALRERYPAYQIVVCADDDHRTAGNPGLHKARLAAKSVGGQIAVPDFGPGRPEEATDFNDLARVCGPEAVRSGIQEAKPATPAPGSSGLIHRCLADVEARPIDWLWPERVARGKLTMLAGHPGLGKSQVTISIAATVSTGGRWPLKAGETKPGRVVFLSAEDDPADTIRPRMEAVGADLSRVIVLDAVSAKTAEGQETQRTFHLGSDLQRLENLIAGFADVALIVIDPISSYLGGTDTHRNADVRSVLAPLSDLAEKHRVAVICVSHLNKGRSGRAIERVTGSMAFVAAARSAYGVVEDPEDGDRRLLLPTKNNLAKGGDGLAFRVEGVTLPSGIETSRVVWDPEPVTITADEAFAAESNFEEQSALASAKEFLEVLLAEGAVPAKEVFRQANDNGHSTSTIRRAKKTMKIALSREGFGPGSFLKWKLPIDDQDSP